MTHSTQLQNFFSHLLNPLITFNSDETKISFYTQSFVKLIGYHSSTDSVPLSVIDSLSYPLNGAIIHNSYKIFQWRRYDYIYQLQQQQWISECVHELRTSSMLIDLGIDIISRDSEKKTDVLHKMENASHRQKVSILIASDFLQLLHTSLVIVPTPLTQVIRDSIFLLQEPYQVQVNTSSIFT